VIFEWDPKKAESNEVKHGISFPEAASVFLDPTAWTFPDPDHSIGEERFITMGQSINVELVLVAHVELEGDKIRIISARRATKRERHDYENG
jgi:hypothetical protein